MGPKKPQGQKSTVPKGADARTAANHPGWKKLTGGAEKIGPGKGSKGNPGSHKKGY